VIERKSERGEKKKEGRERKIGGEIKRKTES
jgi:hypothetical protein